MQVTKIKTFFTRRQTKQALKAAGVALFTGAVMASPAFAQFSQANTVMSWVSTTLAGIAVLAITIAIMLAGFKIAFQHQKLTDVAHILIGGAIIGGASGIAAVVVG
jgi:type IV secretion system protein VirB2